MQPSISWSSAFAFVTVTMTVIHCLKGTVFILTGELAGICLSNSFSSRYYYYFLEYSQPFILSTVLRIFDVKICSHPVWWEHQPPWNKLVIEAPIFSEQHWLYWNKSSHLKQLLFRRKIFFKISSCLEQLLLSNSSFCLILLSYFLVTSTFSNWLLLEDKYFFSTATVLEELFLQNKLFFRACTFSKQILLPNSYFFRRGAFLGAGIS